RSIIAWRPGLPFGSPAVPGAVIGVVGVAGVVVVLAPPPAFASHSATQSFFLAPFFSSFVMSRHCVSQDLVLFSCAETGAVIETAKPSTATEHKPTIKRPFIAASLVAHRKSLGRGARLRPGQSSSSRQF